MDSRLNYLEVWADGYVKVYRLCGSGVGLAGASPFVTIILSNPLMPDVTIAELGLLRHQTRECRGFRIQFAVAITLGCSKLESAAVWFAH